MGSISNSKLAAMILKRLVYICKEGFQRSFILAPLMELPWAMSLIWLRTVWSMLLRSHPAPWKTLSGSAFPVRTLFYTGRCFESGIVSEHGSASRFSIPGYSPARTGKDRHYERWVVSQKRWYTGVDNKGKSIDSIKKTKKFLKLKIKSWRVFSRFGSYSIWTIP